MAPPLSYNPNMEYEPERDPRFDRSYTPQELERARVAFVRGLQMLSTHYEALVQNFGWCAAQIAGDEDTPANIRGMMEFAQAYHEFGLDTALQAIQDTSGVSINVQVPEVVKGARRRDRVHTPGLVVGIVNVEKRRGHLIFDGVAIVLNDLGDHVVVPVWIFPDGTVILDPADGSLRHVHASRQLIEQLNPPENKRTN